MFPTLCKGARRAGAFAQVMGEGLKWANGWGSRVLDALDWGDGSRLSALADPTGVQNTAATAMCATGNG